MALFNRTQKKSKPVAGKVSVGTRAVPKRDFSWVILRPRITEKATLLSEKGVYAFEVSPRATSRDVYYAVRNLYNVVPRKVNMVKTPSTTKQSRRGGKMQVSGVTKAYVFLTKGDTITLA
jgi:large subunit ribosomal protein L23